MPRVCRSVLSGGPACGVLAVSLEPQGLCELEDLVISEGCCDDRLSGQGITLMPRSANER